MGAEGTTQTNADFFEKNLLNACLDNDNALFARYFLETPRDVFDNLLDHHRGPFCQEALKDAKTNLVEAFLTGSRCKIREMTLYYEFLRQICQKDQLEGARHLDLLLNDVYRPLWNAPERAEFFSEDPGFSLLQFLGSAESPLAADKRAGYAARLLTAFDDPSEQRDAFLFFCNHADPEFLAFFLEGAGKDFQEVLGEQTSAPMKDIGHIRPLVNRLRRKV